MANWAEDDESTRYVRDLFAVTPPLSATTPAAAGFWRGWTTRLWPPDGSRF
ncbi:MAG: hypothetical protein AVDCRST_MAG59-305 [uncultured Thermomicrobiales bacterium]|uniref:Uncharacterized protein n=1 Tax=uncultured Thermomicrobiales bacterium TaxID=1645740 RepID=A0A6J4TZ70_9BACT|nr:MAG: hypothetical protein AVDCRST_MAG59-305 [uncultured Thermomicrobiales bacterium]